ncbi:MAG: preprotein translocase subunit YajC [Dongiaceae bacterium]
MGGFDLISFLPIIGIFVVFYFLLIRPQQKKMKEHKSMIASVRRGDRVVTGGGIFGLVTKVLSDSEIQVEIAEGVRVKVLKSTIADIPSRTGTAPAAGTSRDKKSDDEEEDDDTEAEASSESRKS